MNVFIGVMDGVAFLAAAAAAVGLWVRRRRVSSDLRLALWGVLLLLAYLNVSNVPEWFGMTSGLVLLEDYLKVLQPLVWWMVFYIFLRSRGEQELRESEDRYRTVTEGLPLMICSSLPGGKITYVNESYCKYFDKTAEELIGTSFFLMIPEKDRDFVQANMASLTPENPSQSHDHRVIAPGGEIRWHRRVNRAAFDRKGRVTGYQSLGEDITAEKRGNRVLAAELRLSTFSGEHSIHELLQAFLDEAEALTSSEIGFFHFVEPDQKTLTLQAWSSNTLANMCTAEGEGRHYPIEQAGVWVDCAREGRPVIHNDYASQPHRKGMPEGHAPVVREMVVPVYREGKIVAILGVGNKPTDYVDDDVQSISDLASLAWDIISRKRAEEELHDSEARLKILFDQASDAVYLSDSSGHLVQVNRQACRSTGYSEAELLELSVMDVDADYSTPERWGLFFESLRLGEARLIESRHRRKDGEIYPVEINVSLMGLPSGPLVLGIVRDISKRKQAEQALVRQRYHLAKAQEMGKIGTWELDIVRNKLTWTEETYRIFDVPLGTPLTYDTFLSYVHPEDQANVDEMWQAALEGGSYDIEHRIIVNGRTRWVREKAELEFGDGRCVQAIGFTQDITDQRAVEEAIRYERDRAQQYLDVAGSLIVALDAEGRIILLNHAGCESLGVSQEDAIGTSWIDRFIPAEQRERVWHVFHAEMAGHQEAVEYYQNHIVRADGGQRLIAWHNTLLRDHDGKFIGTLSSGEDITEQRKAEDVLRVETRFVEKVIGSCPGLFFTVQRSSEKIIRWNAYLSEVTGYTDVEIAAMTAREFFEEGPDRKHLLESMAEIFSTGTSFMENDLLTKDGRKIPYYFTGERFFMEGEEYVVGFAVDISKRRQMEKEREELQAQVQHAQKLESLGILAGGIAHDFNNLLVGILGNADLALMDMSPPAPERGAIEEIKLAAKRASELVNQMLAYSGKGQYLIQPVNLNDLIEDMGPLLGVSISKKAILRYDRDKQLPLIDADVNQLRQVLMNLIINASDAIGEKTGIISVRTGIVDADREYLTTACLDDDLPEGCYVVLEIVDTGSGMDEKTQAQLFDPFFTTKFTGRGLGLAAVLGIIRGHSGAIKVYSEVGFGTTFKILLPISERAQEEFVMESGHMQEPWSGSGTILVVDDEQSMRAISVMMLERHGFRVLSASDGQEGVDMFRQHADEIDLVLLDMTMPRLSGEEAFRQIRDVRADVKIVLCSGYSEQDATSRFSEEGLAGFVQKPFEMVKLIETVRAAIENT